MGHYLVVANQTLGGQQLLDEMRARIEDDPDCSFHIVVPATPPDEFHFHTEGEAVAVARARLEQALDRLARLDAKLTGDVGDPSPLDAVRDSLRSRTYDGVILSTLPAGISRWLGMDLVSRVRREVDLPLTHVIAQPEEVGPR